MDALTETIERLPREQVFEAVLALKSSFPGADAADTTPEASVASFLDELNTQPFGLVDDIDQLGRTLLLAAAQDEDLGPRVRAVVANTGRKNFIFGANELLLAGETSALALWLLQSWWKNGRAPHNLAVEPAADGRWNLRYGSRLVGTIAGRVGEVVAAILEAVARRTATRFRAFLSYRRFSDSETARAIRAELKVRGIRAFLDVDDLGRDRFDEQLLQRIQEAPNFVVILSPGSLDRCLTDPDDWMRREITQAFDAERNIVPVMREGFSFPPANVAPAPLPRLSLMNGVPYSHTLFKGTIEKLIEYLK